jgi:hypothetical protein
MLGWRRISAETVDRIRYMTPDYEKPALTHVVRTDFESLITPHHKTNLLGFLVLEQPNIARSSFFPLRRCGLETEELSTPRPD